ncbi:hypothetical protein F66182_4530 [Fusarium sp. NRRL 66182]|nr:hypothetical protein F66182_4530 [Fusarium sp. NRRL 66182]
MIDKVVKKLFGGDEFDRLHDPQAIIAKGQYLDQKYSYMYGNYYEKKAREKAAKYSGGYMEGKQGNRPGWSSYGH